ncbi:MAG TPA: ABC transporter permease [Terracidiphilus sp.]|jgi:putative ABC transport system permease protein|nr:ABC transporter permease [Terriglobales bacterium]HEX4756856.1 ABC transporter permease [Terracidiphilus sp.]
MPVTATVSNLAPKLAFSEIMSFAFETFCANKVRFLLTGLGMVIGTASLILVVTIGLTGKQYVLNLIQGIGANLVYAEYEGGAQRITNTAPDPLTIEDMKAAEAEVPGIVSASPVLDLNERVPVGNGKERDLQILGVYPEYRNVRNLVVASGRFFDKQDEQAHNKVGLITETLANQLYGSPEAAIGRIIPLSHLPFTVIGTFRERVNTFGESEVTTSTFLIPYSVARYFTENATVKLIYFSVSDPSMIEPVTSQIKEVIQSRHRAESVYDVTNLTQLVTVADKTANALTAVLLAVAAVVLLVSGIGIMNIMLATVSSRIREIGIRKALGATNREIRFQFLSEAIVISVGGGLIGVVLGLALPYSIRFLTEYRVPISGLSAIVAIVVSSLVGILFGTVPAARAAKLDPVESLRYE